MSLDSLFQQILQTEQQFAEQTQKIKAVKVAITRCNEKIKVVREKYEKASQEQEEKAQQVCVMRLQLELMKRRQEQVSTHLEELLRTRDHLMEQLASIKNRSSKEQEKFSEELCRFNIDMSLTADPETVTHRKMEEDLQELMRAEDTLKQEMEQMSHSNRHVSCVQEEKKALLLELQGLESINTDVDAQLSQADALTQTYRAQRDAVSQKPQTEPTCLRLRKELEMYREGEMEALREALSSEITFLQTRLADLQRGEQHQV